MDKRLINLVLLLCTINCLILSGCGTSLGVANYQSTITPLQYEGHNDTTSVEQSALYVSGFHSTSIDESDGHKAEMGGVSLYKSHTAKAYAYSYGAFGYIGNFRVGMLNSNIINTNQALFGSGITGSSSLRLGKRRKFLDLGLRLSLLYEGGEYSDFRRAYEQTDRFFTNRHPNRITMHSAAQMTFKFSISQLNCGVYNSLGMISFGGDGLTTIMNMGLFASYNRFTLNTDIAAGELYTLGLATIRLTYKVF